MARYAMVIDLNSCVGCLACTIACLRENVARQLEDGVDMPDPPLQYARTRPVERYDVRVRGWPARVPLFVQCHHCDNPPCVAACPTGASHVADGGLVLTDKERCIGCRACMVACPYGARTMYLRELRGEPPNPLGLEPLYPDKCTFCAHRRRGREAWTPACVEACAFGARIFGDLDDPGSEVSKLVRGGHAVALREWLGTEPKLFMVPPRKLRG